MLVSLISAYTDDTTTLSEVRIARVVKYHREHGATGFFVCGATAECFLMSVAERKQLLEWVIRESHGLPVWTHATSMTTAATVDLCQHAARHGARGAIVTPPPSYRMYPHEIKAYLTSVARHGNIQSLLADSSGEWAPLLEATSLAMVAHVPEEFSISGDTGQDEFLLEDGVVTPLAMFGADKVPKLLARPELYKPALSSLLMHGGLGRSARAALASFGVDVGPSRGPILELNESGKKILSGIVAAMSAA